MNPEAYLNHPTFGLLYRICCLEKDREVFTTLYAQRMFFLIDRSGENFSFQPIVRNEAKTLVENQLRYLRRQLQVAEANELQLVYKQTFM
jgi:PII interaction protein X